MFNRLIPPSALSPLGLLALALLALTGCGSAPTLSVDKGYIRLAAVPSRPAVAYFTLHGGPSDTVLIDVTSPVSVRTEMHESMMTGNASTGSGQAMATMKPIDDVPVPAGSSVVFAPGGKHLMLFDMNPGIKPGRKVTLTFTFSNNSRVDYDAPTIAAGAPAPTE